MRCMHARQALLQRLGVFWSGDPEDSNLNLFGPEMSPDTITTLRTALFGTVLAAGAARRDLPPGPQPELVEARADTTGAAFAVALAEEPLRLDQLLPHFVPAAFLYTSAPARTRLDFLWTLDRASPPGCLKTLTVLSNGITAARGTEMKVHGDAFLMPPALRGEGKLRSDWVRRVGLDPPRRRDACGPYWRLGNREAWRLDVLSWHERLVLAVLIGTGMETCAVLAPAAHFPRVGFVLETARRFGRTIVCVALEHVPDTMRARLEDARRTQLVPDAPAEVAP